MAVALVSILAQDRVGLVSEIADHLFEAGVNLGDTTFAITSLDAEHPVPVQGAFIGLEVNDLEAEVARLHSLRVPFKREIRESAVCRYAIILDPDGSEILIHRRK